MKSFALGVAFIMRFTTTTRKWPIELRIVEFITAHLEYYSPLLVGLGKGQRNRLEDGNFYILRRLIGHNKSMS